MIHQRVVMTTTLDYNNISSSTVTLLDSSTWRQFSQSVVWYGMVY